MNWYTKAKVKPTEESNFQDEETADPEVDVSDPRVLKKWNI